MQEVLQLGDDLHQALVGVEPLGTLVLVDLILADVALGELEELLLVATLGMVIVTLASSCHPGSKGKISSLAREAKRWRSSVMALAKSSSRVSPSMRLRYSMV